MKNVEEMNPESFKIFELIRQPMAVAFIDFNHASKRVVKDSIHLVDNVLPEVAPAFFHGLSVAYADNNSYHKYRKILGITNEK